MTGETRIARCHCGAVEVEAYLPDGLASAARCDCSFCRRRGAAAVTALAARTRVIKGQDALRLYSFGTHTAQHYFCSICGIYTHHQRRSDPKECGVNLGAILDVNPKDHEPMPWNDGVNHPSDAV